MTSANAAVPDPLTAASSAVAKVIAFNKPIYPLYVWWLAPAALQASLLTLIFFPVYAAVPFMARRYPLASRITMLVSGTADTLLITKVMGEPSGSWLFLIACLILSGLLFYESERLIGLVSTAIISVLFAVFFHRYGIPFVTISDADLQTLFSLNAFGAVGLVGFIAIRFPRLKGS